MEYIDKSHCSVSPSSEANVDELSETISMLKTYISLLESTIEIPEDQSQESLKLLHETAISHDKSEVQTELCRNICQFAKVECINFKRDSRFIFEISDSENVVKSDLYTIEILVDNNGHGKLGKYVLPDFVNVQNILWQYPIDNFNNVKHFLKSCKHDIDSYFNRLNQINALKNLLLNIQNACVYHNNDITLIELKMYNVNDIYTRNMHDVIMHLHYRSGETRPYKLYTSTNDVKVKSSSFYIKLNMYFMPILKKDLNLAFMQTVNSCVKFIWQKVMIDDEDNIDVYEYEEKIYDMDDEGTEYLEFVEQYLCRRDSKTSETKVQLEITSDKDEMEINTKLAVERKKIHEIEEI